MGSRVWGKWAIRPEKVERGKIKALALSVD
jgi:hypothetical protein